MLMMSEINCKREQIAIKTCTCSPGKNIDEEMRNRNWKLQLFAVSMGGLLWVHPSW